MIRRIAFDSTLSKREVEGEPPPDVGTIFHTGANQALVQLEELL